MDGHFSSRRSPDPGIEPAYPVSPELAGGLSTWDAHQAQKVDPLIEQVDPFIRTESRVLMKLHRYLDIFVSYLFNVTKVVHLLQVLENLGI